MQWHACATTQIQKIQFKPSELSSYGGNTNQADKPGCRTGAAADKYQPEGGMKEIIFAFAGSLLGAALACLTAVILRYYNEWKSFQERIFIVQERFERVNFESRCEIGTIIQIHTGSLNEVAEAVSRIRPYLVSSERRMAMNRLLEKYRRAQSAPGSGFITAMPDPTDKTGYEGFNPKIARDHAIEILDDMAFVMKWWF